MAIKNKVCAAHWEVSVTKLIYKSKSNNWAWTYNGNSFFIFWTRQCSIKKEYHQYIGDRECLRVAWWWVVVRLKRSWKEEFTLITCSSCLVKKRQKDLENNKMNMKKKKSRNGCKRTTKLLLIVSQKENRKAQWRRSSRDEQKYAFKWD